MITRRHEEIEMLRGREKLYRSPPDLLKCGYLQNLILIRALAIKMKKGRMRGKTHAWFLVRSETGAAPPRPHRIHPLCFRFGLGRGL
jgi:hypothetical protein